MTIRSGAGSGLSQQQPAGQHSCVPGLSEMGEVLVKIVRPPVAGDWTADGMSCRAMREHFR